MLRRQREKKLADVRGRERSSCTVLGGRDVESAVEMKPDVETQAALDALLWVQNQWPDSFVNVLHEKGSLKYASIFLPNGRLDGSLFGDVRAVDDKHSVSVGHYKLAAVGVCKNNGACGIGGVAIMASSDSASWRAFTDDMIDAFEAEGGKPARHWGVLLSDQDAAIASAMRRSGEQFPDHVWRCLWHFRRLLV
eukprot:GHVU01134118.1.p1 GENE.GHVU01134118.1~~GHVU01134118.1.p1  ORF type:complete len:194 (+),score=16.32 GHVU01134118.1:90-671(+)